MNSLKLLLLLTHERRFVNKASGGVSSVLWVLMSLSESQDFFAKKVSADSNFLVSHRVHRASEKSCSGLVRGQSRARHLPQFFFSKNWGNHLMHEVSLSANSEGLSDPREAGRAGERISYSRGATREQGSEGT